MAKLSAEDIDEVFSDLIEFVMDGLGLDNYGDIHDVLEDIGLSEDRIAALLS